jgi:hypothetical protein
LIRVVKLYKAKEQIINKDEDEHEQANEKHKLDNMINQKLG